MIVARAGVQLGHAFDLHVTVLELPVVVGLEEDSADEPHDRVLVGESARRLTSLLRCFSGLVEGNLVRCWLGKVMWASTSACKRRVNTRHIGRLNFPQWSNSPDPAFWLPGLGGLRFAFPKLHTIIADAGHESRRLAQHLKRHDGYTLQIVKRRQRAFKIVGMTWIVERSIAWLNRNRRLAKDFQYRVRLSETMLAIAAIRLMLNRLTPA